MNLSSAERFGACRSDEEGEGEGEGD
jgi:transcriptional antiterminator